MFYLFILPSAIGLEFLSLAPLPCSRPTFFAPCSSRYSRAIYQADLTVSFVVVGHCLPEELVSRVRFKNRL